MGADGAFERVGMAGMPSVRVGCASGCEIGLDAPSLGGNEGALLLAEGCAGIVVELSGFVAASLDVAFAVGLDAPILGSNEGALLLAEGCAGIVVELSGFVVASLDAALVAGLGVLFSVGNDGALPCCAGIEVTLSERVAVPSAALADGVAVPEGDGCEESGLDGSLGAFVPPPESLGNGNRLGVFGLLG